MLRQVTDSYDRGNPIHNYEPLSKHSVWVLACRCCLQVLFCVLRQPDIDNVTRLELQHHLGGRNLTNTNEVRAASTGQRCVHPFRFSASEERMKLEEIWKGALSPAIPVRLLQCDPVGVLDIQPDHGHAPLVVLQSVCANEIPNLAALGQV